MSAASPGDALPKRLEAALASRYSDWVEVGRGASAVVFRARDVRHERWVAVKVLRAEFSSAIGAERFGREIRATAGLQHPHIVALLDSGVTPEGDCYLVMPFVDGESLRDRLRRSGALALEDALRIARDVADALAFAHGRDLIHRDIKPANILLSGAHAYVADFGLVKSLQVVDAEGLTMSGLAVGTPAYMSPEQGLGSDTIEGRSDIYALGCVLYEMLAGDPPFAGRTVEAVLAKHRLAEPASLALFRAHLPDRVLQIVERSLAKNPADRFASASELFRSLDTALAGMTSEREGVTRRRRSWRHGSRPVLLSVAAILAVGTAVKSVVSRQGPPLERERIIVFPLDVQSGLALEGSDGTAIATYIGYALDHTEPLRWIEGDPRLTTIAKASGDTLSVARNEAAISERAGYFIDGLAFRDRDSVRVLLRLYDVAGDSLLARAAAAGGLEESLPRLGVRAVALLIPRLIPPGGRVEVSELASRSPRVVTNFLRGESAYRQTHYGDALAFYERAIEEDSAFALAAVKAALAAAWQSDRAKQSQLMSIALRQSRVIPPRFRMMVFGVSEFLAGDADSSAALLQQAILADSLWPDAHMALAEVFQHLLTSKAPADSAAMAAAAAALLVDSLYSPARSLLAEHAFYRRDTLPLSRLLREHGNAPSDLLETLALALRCVRERWPVDRWVEEVRASPSRVLSAAKYLATRGTYPVCGRDALRTVAARESSGPSVRWGAVFVLSSLAAAIGDTLLASNADSLANDIGNLGPILRFLRSTASFNLVEARVLLRNPSRGALAEASPTRLWMLSVAAALARDTLLADSLVAFARAQERSPSRVTTRSASVFAAHAAWARRDTVRAITLLANLKPHAALEDITWQPWSSLGFERLLWAELLAGRGQLREAAATLALLDASEPVLYLMYRRSSLELGRDLARRLGRTQRANHLDSLIQALRLDASP